MRDWQDKSAKGMDVEAVSTDVTADGPLVRFRAVVITKDPHDRAETLRELSGEPMVVLTKKEHDALQNRVLELFREVEELRKQPQAATA